MTTVRTSNPAYLFVLDPLPTPKIGWDVQIISPDDYTTILDIVPHWKDLTFTRQLSSLGYGTIEVPKTSRFLTRSIPGGGTVFERPCMFRVYDEGVLRFDFLYEGGSRPDVSEDKDTFVLAGPGTGKVLADGTVYPAGWPVQKKETRTFTAAKRIPTWVTLFNEAQARGCFPMVDLTFSATTDSAGYTWTDLPETFDVNRGDNLLDLLDQWCALIGATWIMRPGFQLMIYQSFGTARHTGDNAVVFHAGGHLLDHVSEITFDGMATEVIATSGDSVAAATDSAAATLYRRREVWVDAGDAGTSSAAQKYADKNLAEKQTPSMQRTVVIPFDATKRRTFVDFDYGDTVGVDVNGSIAPVRITAITCKVNQDNQTTAEIVVDKEQAPRLARVIAQGAQIRRQGGRKVDSRASKPRSVVTTATAVATGVVQDLAVLPTRQVIAGTGLTGGGTLAADRTVALDQEFVQDLVAAEIVAGTNVTKVYDDTAGTVTLSASPPTRGTTVINTASLTDGSVENQNVTLAAAYRVYSVTVDRACRVRLYTTSAKRSSDAGRAPGTDPTGDHGCMLDLVFTGAGTLTLSPTVDGFVPSGTAVPYAIQNNSGGASPVQVSMTWVRTE